MYPSSILTALTAISGIVVATPISISAGVSGRGGGKSNGVPGGDCTILNYALTLEYLERKFYQEGLANYTEADFLAAGFDVAFYASLQKIKLDEESHVTFLASVLGDKAVKEATYAFPSVDAKSFVALASVLEGVGVSAYLGAAASIASRAYLTAAGSILTVEARHSAFIRRSLGQAPFPKPYDTPLGFNAVFSLAAQFITGFAPGDKPLPFKAFPPLTVAAAAAPGSGGYIAGEGPVVFTGAAANAQGMGIIGQGRHVYAVFYSGLDTYYVPAAVDGRDYKVDAIPAGAADKQAPVGQVYVVLSTADGQGSNTARDENIISGVGILEVMAQ